jgi:ankyrin repeat protein
MKYALSFLSLLLTSLCCADTLTSSLRSAGFTELHEAAWNNDSNKIRMLVKNGMNVNSPSDSGTTPLHSATSKGQIEAARALIELGANLEARDEMGRTPLFVTVEVNPHPKAAVELLLDAGASAAAPDKFGKTPLQAAWTEEARLVLLSYRPNAGLR